MGVVGCVDPNATAWNDQCPKNRLMRSAFDIA
jgi:hypothetical protein